MPVSRSGRLLAEGIAAANLCLVLGGLLAAGDSGASRAVLVADGTTTGSALSPGGLALGSTNGGPKLCLALGSAISLSGESALSCTGITSGSA